MTKSEKRNDYAKKDSKKDGKRERGPICFNCGDPEKLRAKQNE